MHPELLSLSLFMLGTSCSPGPNNIVASYSGFNFGVIKTFPHMLGVIFGFTTINEGIKVHNVNCPNAIQLQSRYAYRIMKAEWATVENLKYSAVLGIKGFDQIGLINKITRLISNEMNVNISSINIKSNNGIFNGVISVIVINKVHLENLINKLESIDGVESIERL